MKGDALLLWNVIDKVCDVVESDDCLMAKRAKLVRLRGVRWQMNEDVAV